MPDAVSLSPDAQADLIRGPYQLCSTGTNSFHLVVVRTSSADQRRLEVIDQVTHDEFVVVRALCPCLHLACLLRCTRGM